MVTDEELAHCVESLLRQAGPTISASDISVPNLVRHLEEKLGIDLSHKEPFIRHQIAMLLPPPPPPPPPPTQNDRFTPPALFHRFQYHPPNLSAAAFQNQQEMLMKFQTVQEASHVRSGVSHVTEPSRVADVAEPEREEVKPVVVAATGVKESTPAPAKRRGGPGGLNKMCGVSPELQTIVGEPTMARTQIVKQLWAYIRKNNLQDPNNKRKIICNDELRLLFETDCTDMFKMNKLLAKHIIPLSEPSREAKKVKRESSEVVSFEGTESDKVVMISDALAEFLGTGGERKMLRSEAVDRVWDHIRTNRLEDPRNAMVIICDEKLQQLFGCENVSAMGISELLSRHCYLQSNPCIN